MFYQVFEIRSKLFKFVGNLFHVTCQKIAPSRSFCTSCNFFHKWKRLSGGTVPLFKMHLGGTVPLTKMHPGGTLDFYDVFLCISISRSQQWESRGSRTMHNYQKCLLVKKDIILSVLGGKWKTTYLPLAFIIIEGDLKKDL